MCISNDEIFIELCTAKLKIDYQFIFIHGVYRPHIGSVDGFMTIIDQISQNALVIHNKSLIIADLSGDQTLHPRAVSHGHFPSIDNSSPVTSPHG